MDNTTTKFIQMNAALEKAQRDFHQAFGVTSLTVLANKNLVDAFTHLVGQVSDLCEGQPRLDPMYAIANFVNIGIALGITEIIAFDEREELNLEPISSLLDEAADVAREAMGIINSAEDARINAQLRGMATAKEQSPSTTRDDVFDAAKHLMGTINQYLGAANA